MTYQPLSEARETLKVQWYRSPMPPERFRALSQSSDRQAWFQAGGHLALVTTTGVAVYATWASASWGAFLIALFLHGTFGSFLRGTAVHELGHGTVFKTKRLNKVFLYLFSLLSWWTPSITPAATPITTATRCTPKATAKTFCRFTRMSGARFSSRCSR